MNIYPLFKPMLMMLDAERAHDVTLASLRTAQRYGLLRGFAPTLTEQATNVMGIGFPNRVGLAAGLDKNGAVIDGMASLGFGFIEIGTVTPRAQPGNPKPRLFRLPAVEGIINRFGFNNLGVDQLIQNVKAAQYRGVLGINIGKNFDTPNERAAEDYVHCLHKVYAYASYVTVNISSPNTKHLRALQEKTALSQLLATLKAEQAALTQVHGKYVPIALKIAPDLTTEQIQEIAQLLMQHQFDGVIATNTTLSREAVQGLAHADEAGGLSGTPVKNASTTVIRTLAKELQGSLPIIGVGGILSGGDAQEKMAAGASLVQVYSGLIYKGPALVTELRRALQ